MSKSSFAEKENNAPAEPINIGERAMDNLRYIRETMERSTSFTAVPGFGGMLMGATAVAASYIAHQQIYLRNWLVVWLTEAALASAIGLLAMWQKSKAADQSLISTPARKFAFGFTPALVCGVIATLGLWRYEHYEVMAPMWMIIYGSAVVAGGAYSVRAVPIMGWLFIAFGAAAFALPAGFGDVMMAASFGGLHIIFGAVIAKNYGG
jgi:hypothetical protein